MGNQGDDDIDIYAVGGTSQKLHSGNERLNSSTTQVIDFRCVASEKIMGPGICRVGFAGIAG